MIPKFKDVYIVTFYDEYNNVIDKLKYNVKPMNEDVIHDMEMFRTNYPFKETSKFKIKKITNVEWVDENE